MDIIIFVSFTFILSAQALTCYAQDGDGRLSVPEIITKYGYPVEEHFVTTTDGYILRLHRIPHGKKTNTNSEKVVFLMHGLLSSSADWIIPGTDSGLGYILADAGYDVWMGNARGNHFSRNHTSLNPDKGSRFWQFSFHEIGVLDLPAMIDHTLSVTKQTQLIYIGHSQGTTSFYVLTSTLPEYNKKIKAQFSLAPIAYMDHITSPLMHVLAFWSGPLNVLTRLIGVNEFFPRNEFLKMLGDDLCSDGGVTQVLCTNAMFAISGFSPNQINASLIPVIMGHSPAGGSVKQFRHYAQEINSGHFRQYDYNRVGNLAHYGSLRPPKYNLSNIKTQVFLFFSRNDWLSAETDVLRLCAEMGEACQAMLLVADGKFNHLDYMFGITAPDLVYKRVLSIMERL